MLKAFLVSILIMTAHSAETITVDLVHNLGGRIRLNQTSRGTVPELPDRDPKEMFLARLYALIFISSTIALSTGDTLEVILRAIKSILITEQNANY